MPAAAGDAGCCCPLFAGASCARHRTPPVTAHITTVVISLLFIPLSCSLFVRRLPCSTLLRNFASAGLLSRKFLVNHVAQAFVIDCTREELVVEEETGGAVQTQFLGFCQVTLHCSRVFTLIQALIEASAVQAQLARVLLELFHIQAAARKQQVVILPVLA